MKIFSEIKQLIKYLCSHKRFYLLVREKGKTVPQINNECHVEFASVNNENIADTMIFEEKRYLNIYKKMLEEGEYGEYGYLKGQCVYRLWVKMRGEEKYLKKTILSLEESDACIHYVYTKEEARGRGVCTMGINEICRVFSDRRLFTFVKPSNIASLKSFLKNGFVKEKKLDIYYFLGIPIVLEKIPVEGNYESV